MAARLIEAEYRKVSAAQAQIDRRSSRLLAASFLFAAPSVLLAFLFAVVTVRMVGRLTREMEWQAAELGRVSWHMLEDQEATARRFSHELHDELGQSLTAVKTNLTALEAGGKLDRARLEDCLHLVEEAIGNVRQLSQLLRPTILDDFGLEAGLRWLVEGFAARTGIEATLQSSCSGRLPDETETHLFRIAQEALTNVARHLPRQITHRNIFRVSSPASAWSSAPAGGGRRGGAQYSAIQQNAASLVREQSVTNRLIDELQNQQTSLSEVFSVLARDPDSVDYDRIMSQLDAADRDIDRISAEGAQTAERDLWARLQQSSLDFSRRGAPPPQRGKPETFASIELFRHHEAFVSVAARLIEAEYRKVSAAQAQIDRRSSRLLAASFLFAAPSVLLALLFAVVTVRMVARLTREMEWQAAELGRVSWHMLEDQEATARRFSHELHDELGQSLTAVKTNLTALDAGGQAGPRASGRLPAPGGRGHRQRAPDVAASAPHHPRRFRPGGRPALARGGLRRAHRHRGDSPVQLLRPPSR